MKWLKSGALRMARLVPHITLHADTVVTPSHWQALLLLIYRDL